MLLWLNYKETQSVNNCYFPATKECFLFTVHWIIPACVQSLWKPPSLSGDCVIRSGLFLKDYLFYYQHVRIWVDNDLMISNVLSFSLGKLEQYSMTWFLPLAHCYLPAGSLHLSKVSMNSQLLLFNSPGICFCWVPALFRTLETAANIQNDLYKENEENAKKNHVWVTPLQTTMCKKDFQSELKWKQNTICHEYPEQCC